MPVTFNGLRKTDEITIATSERSILRRIFGPKKDNNTWKI